MKNLSLSLFAFHIYNTLDDAPDTKSREADQLWESLGQVGQLLGCAELNINNLTSKLNLLNNNSNNEWLNRDQKPLKLTITDQNNYQISGELSAFRLHDTYCADLTLYPLEPQQKIDIEQFPDVFRPIQLIDTIQANLGKIIWLTGESEDLNQLSQEKAIAWAEQFTNKSTPVFMGEDQLFNSPLFIFQTDNLTILISLAKPDTVDLKRVTEDYSWVRELFWSYSKIKFIYGKAQECYYLARKIYSQLENNLKSFHCIANSNNSECLEKLDQLLKTVPQNFLQYVCYLRDLKAHYTTIQVNTDNFTKCIEYLEKSGDILNTWSNFTKKNYPHYLKQVQTHINYLEPGKELFNDLINIIRATTELEKAKSNKVLEESNQNLQDQIQAVGVGLAVGAIIASTSSITTILVSAGIGFCSWYLVKTYIKAKHDNKKFPEFIRQIINQSQITKLLKGR